MTYEVYLNNPTWGTIEVVADRYLVNAAEPGHAVASFTRDGDEVALFFDVAAIVAGPDA